MEFLCKRRPIEGLLLCLCKVPIQLGITELSVDFRAFSISREHSSADACGDRGKAYSRYEFLLDIFPQKVRILRYIECDNVQNYLYEQVDFFAAA